MPASGTFQLCPILGNPTGCFNPSLKKMAMRITGDRHVNAPAWYPLFNNQLLFPLTSRVEATGRRTIPKAKKTKKRRTQFRARLPRPWMGRRALPAVSHGPEATVYQEPKTNPGGSRGGTTLLPSVSQSCNSPPPRHCSNGAPAEGGVQGSLSRQG